MNLFDFDSHFTDVCPKGIFGNMSALLKVLPRCRTGAKQWPVRRKTLSTDPYMCHQGLIC